MILVDWAAGHSSTQQRTPLHVPLLDGFAHGDHSPWAGGMHPHPAVEAHRQLELQGRPQRCQDRGRGPREQGPRQRCGASKHKALLQWTETGRLRGACMGSHHGEGVDQSITQKDGPTAQQQHGTEACHLPQGSSTVRAFAETETQPPISSPTHMTFPHSPCHSHPCRSASAPHPCRRSPRGNTPGPPP